MSGLPSRPGGVWQEAKTKEGKVYYYNTQTKATQWTKPAEMMTAEERALQSQPYKEYKTPEGRPYWYHTTTKETTWVMPEGFKQVVAQVKPVQPKPVQQSQHVAAPVFVAGGGLSFTPTGPASSHKQDDYRNNDRHNDRERLPPISDVRSAAAAAASAAAASNFASEYTSFDDAQEGFFALLERIGVRPNWRWEDTIRSAVKDPAYWALKNTKDRRESFKKYIDQLCSKEADNEVERQAKLQEDFCEMLRRHSQVSYFTRWRTARPIIEDEPEFQDARSEEEREVIFRQYRALLYKEHQEAEAQARKAGVEALESILDDLGLEPYTPWPKASDALHKNQRFVNDSQISALSKFDILKAFESHLKSLERDFNDDRQKKKTLRIRTERKHRDGFIQLLKELQKEEKIQAGTKWKAIVPEIEKDERYIAILGQGGSTPLELFFDTIEDEERKVRVVKNDVLDVLDDKNFEVAATTTEKEFLSIVCADHRVENVSKAIISLIFSRLQAKAAQRDEEDKHNQEKHTRKLIDNLRYRIKRLEPRVTTADTWATVRPRVAKTSEFLAIEDEDVRESSFEKVVRRLKERSDRDEEDKDSRSGATASRRDRDRDGEKDRDGDRYYANDYDQDRRDRERERERNYRASDRYSDRGDRDRPRVRTRDRERDSDRDRPRDRERERGGDRYPAHPNESRDRDRDSRRTRSPDGAGSTYDSTDRRKGGDRDRERDRGDRTYRSDSITHSVRRDYDEPTPRFRDRDDRGDRSAKEYISRADPLEQVGELDYGDGKLISVSVSAPSAVHSSGVSVASAGRGGTGRKRQSEDGEKEKERGDDKEKVRAENGHGNGVEAGADKEDGEDTGDGEDTDNQRATKKSRTGDGTAATTATTATVKAGKSGAAKGGAAAGVVGEDDEGRYHSGSEEGEIEED